MTEPEAIQLVESSPYLEGGERGQWIIDAAAELRRLYAVNEELLEALKLIADVGDRAATEISRAAIAKAEGKT